MKKLINKKFNFQGFNMEQVMRAENKAIYAQINEDGITVAYEVIRIKEKAVRGLLLKSEKYQGYDTYEHYPSSEEFGSNAWSFSGINKYQKAMDKYNTL